MPFQICQKFCKIINNLMCNEENLKRCIFLLTGCMQIIFKIFFAKHVQFISSHKGKSSHSGSKSADSGSRYKSPVLHLKGGLWILRKSQKMSDQYFLCQTSDQYFLCQTSDQYFLSSLKKNYRGEWPPCRYKMSQFYKIKLYSVKFEGSEIDEKNKKWDFKIQNENIKFKLLFSKCWGYWDLKIQIPKKLQPLF